MSLTHNTGGGSPHGLGLTDVRLKSQSQGPLLAQGQPSSVSPRGGRCEGAPRGLLPKDSNPPGLQPREATTSQRPHSSDSALGQDSPRESRAHTVWGPRTPRAGGSARCLQAGSRGSPQSPHFVKGSEDVSAPLKG